MASCWADQTRLATPFKLVSVYFLISEAVVVIVVIVVVVLVVVLVVDFGGFVYRKTPISIIY